MKTESQQKMYHMSLSTGLRHANENSMKLNKEVMQEMEIN